MTVAPRWTVGMVQGPGLAAGEGAWGDTRVIVPEGGPRRWQDVLRREELECEGELKVGRILGRFPVALLESVDQQR